MSRQRQGSDTVVLNSLDRELAAQDAGLDCSIMLIGPKTLEDLTLEHLQQIGRRLRKSVEVKDRWWRLMLFRQCFLGTEATESLITDPVTRKFAKNTDLAVKLG